MRRMSAMDLMPHMNPMVRDAPDAPHERDATRWRDGAVQRAAT
jgi:hypothetical protein